MTEISGKSAVVTGAGSGIGKGLAKALAKAGASVVVSDINMDNAQAVAEEIRLVGGRAIALQCDVCEREAVVELQARSKATFGPIQLLFANAGATSFTPLAEMSNDDVDWIIQVNLMGTLYSTQAFLPDMLEAGEGHITATASMAGLMPGWIPIHAPYSAAKAGIIGLMMNLAMETRDHGVHTSIYCPGGVASKIKARNGSYRPQRFGGPEPVAEVQFSGTSTTHSSLDFFTPDDIAPIVLDGVQNNRMFIFDHAEQRRFFSETYASVVEAGYDAIEDWERQNGRPVANPYGADLIDAS